MLVVSTIGLISLGGRSPFTLANRLGFLTLSVDLRLKRKRTGGRPG
jgi:hypothetical protein